ncbi:MAG: Gx transporter family protein [Alphaproteobacteria bacterium]|uniref:Gx transporter family protein n=1 Tax=Candidatus Nitrobium versatile TaxID=2884831 RepID=A0A953M2T4_9BACT|nr:Gx transporter family protein [Candidatus Nitrobium versatile]
MESRDRYRIALLASYALALHGIETLLPTPIPWFKLGLSNIITMITLYRYGTKSALMVTLIRVLLGSLLLGTFLGPAFFLSLGGGLAGVLSMAFAARFLPGLFSPLGISLIGAFFHNVAQLFVAYLLFVQRIEAIVLVAPLLMATGVLTGMVNGIAARYLLLEMQESEGRAPA